MLREVCDGEACCLYYWCRNACVERVPRPRTRRRLHYTIARGMAIPAALCRTSTNEARLWDADLLLIHIKFKELRTVHDSLLD